MRCDEHLFTLFFQFLDFKLFIVKRLRHLLISFIYLSILLSEISDLLKLILELRTVEIPRSIVTNDKLVLERDNLAM